MDVKNSTAIPPNLQANNAQPVAAKNERQAEQQQATQTESTVVKLSDQAQQLQRAEVQNNVETQNRRNAETQQRASAENQQRINAENQQRAEAQRNETNARQKPQPSGISFVSGENKGGRIKTSA